MLSREELFPAALLERGLQLFLEALKFLPKNECFENGNLRVRIHPSEYPLESAFPLFRSR